jgi:zinc finger SWIM domain-containing protein 3
MILLYGKGQRLTMDLQLYYHKIIVSRIAKELGGADVARKYLGHCIYAVQIGYNDYLNNYFAEGYNSSKIYTPEQFAQLLVLTYEIQLEVSSLKNHSSKKLIC